MRFTAAVTQEARLFVAQCLEVDVASQGTSVDEALENLREALLVRFEEGLTNVRSSPVIAEIEIDVPVGD